MLPKLSSSAIALALTFSHPAMPAAGAPDLASVRAATARFQDVKVAIAEGYVREPMNACDTAAMIGWSMSGQAGGVHFFRPDLVGIKASPGQARIGGTENDVLTPGILVYQPREDGSLELVAVENLRLRWEWREAGDKVRPTPASMSYGLKDDPSTKVNEAQMFEPRYNRRLWIFRDNPNRIVGSFDPGEICRDPNASTVSALQPNHSGGR